MSSAATLREQAMAAERQGQLDQARALFARLEEQAQRDPGLINSVAGFHLRQGGDAKAELLYRRAHELAPREPEFAINLAIVLGRLNRRRGALSILRKAEAYARGSARYWSARASAERELGELAEAAKSYEQCLILDPAHGKARHGLARVALERSAPDAAGRFLQVLSADQNNLEAWLGYAQALEMSGEFDKAVSIAETLARQYPGWIEALNVLSQFRLSIGADDFTDGFRQAELAAPDDLSIVLAHCRALSGLDRFAEAAQVARNARARFPDDGKLALLEAIHRGEAGDDDGAEAIFSVLPDQTGERWIHEARHWLRRQEADRAERLLAKALEDDDSLIGAWALRGIAWRMLGDSRSEWLHGQDGLVTPIQLDLSDSDLAAVRVLLHDLHDKAAQPLSQSVRGGTQTRGALFARQETELAGLKASLMRALEAYRAELPPADASHPLLRHRDAPWHIFGSWSVRLTQGGRHTEHIHPQGVISSALYLELNADEGGEPKAGWLELGRPPPDLRLELGPLFDIKPEVGRLALFPSTLYHGTRKFGAGRRMTVAYDVAPLA